MYSSKSGKWDISKNSKTLLQKTLPLSYTFKTEISPQNRCRTHSKTNRRLCDGYVNHVCQLVKEMSEPVPGPGPNTIARPATPPPPSSMHDESLQLTPERVRQVELNRLRGTVVLFKASSLFSLLDAASSVLFNQPRPDSARRRHPQSPLPCATPTARDRFPSFPPSPARQPPPRRRQEAISYSGTRDSGNISTMICQRWSTQRVAFSLRTIRKWTMVQRPRRGNAKDKGLCRTSTLVRAPFMLPVSRPP